MAWEKQENKRVSDYTTAEVPVFRKVLGKA